MEDWEEIFENVGEVQELIRIYRILLIRKITGIKLKCSFSLYSKLKSTHWVILDLKGYGPGVGCGNTVSFHLSFCPFLEKLSNTEVWTTKSYPPGHEKLLWLYHLRRPDKPVLIYFTAQCGSTSNQQYLLLQLQFKAWVQTSTDSERVSLPKINYISSSTYFLNTLPWPATAVLT